MSDGIYAYYIRADVEPEIVADVDNNTALNLESDFLSVKGFNNARAYWLATPSARNVLGNNMVSAYNNGFNINHTTTAETQYGGGSIGLRPVVKLNNNVSLVDVGNGTFNLE